MYIITPENAASTKISVTSTATALFSLMDTAGSIATSEGYYNDFQANAVLIKPEDGDIRVLSKATPTTSVGFLLKSGTSYYFPGLDLTSFNMIRTGSANVACSIQLGKSTAGESWGAVADNVSLTLDEFPAASAASDNFANPTTTDVKAFGMVWDGTTWDRQPGTSTEGTYVSGGKVDDAAFTPATDRVLPVGFIADDTATDSVDEGDVGAARMSLDRKQIMAGSYVDDAAFTPAGSNSYVMMMGAEADDTSPDSVDEGDAGALRMTTTRFLKVSQGDLISGEDQTNNVMQVVVKPLASSTYAATSTSNLGAATAANLKASTGNALSCYATNTNASIRYFQLHNKASIPLAGEAPVYSFIIPASSGMIVVGNDFFGLAGINFSSGIGYAISTTAATYTAATAGDHMSAVTYI